VAVILPQGALLTPLRIIPTAGGPVMHAMKAVDPGFHGFGEAYFSAVEQHAVKGWKRHRQMVSNLVVPSGAVRLQMLDDRPDSPTHGLRADVTLGPDNYQRLTVPPGIWLAFQGRAPGLNLLLNLASIAHDPMESDNCPLDAPLFADVTW
jgi:dTDP-4-dehydrorhamnose 3,5-epimerase